MKRILPRGIALALVLTPSAAPALAQQGAKAQAKPGPEKAGPDRQVQDRQVQDRQVQDRSAPVIGCLSLANYRLLMRHGGPAAAAQLADPKADHLGCAALPRGRLTGVADRTALGAQSYDCASVQGTSACQWMEAGTIAMPAARTAP